MMALRKTVSKEPLLLQARGLTIQAPGGRELIRDLNLGLSTEKVALVGRNGAGKSTLLRTLAGLQEPHAGRLTVHTTPHLVPQDIETDLDRTVADIYAPTDARSTTRRQQMRRQAGLRQLPDHTRLSSLSRGERRKWRLIAAMLPRPDLLLMDEPTQDLDDTGQQWLKSCIARWSGGLLVATHDRALLPNFHHFFVVAESGCWGFEGTFAALEAKMEEDAQEEQRRYVRHLNVLTQQEAHHERVGQRRARKKNVGRLHELDRCTSRARLNEKRGYAQESQGKRAKMQNARRSATRAWAKAARRALSVNLPLELMAPPLGEPCPRPVIRLDGVSVGFEGRTLVQNLDLTVSGRQRIGIVGPNGTGKTTLLKAMLQSQAPLEGRVVSDLGRVGAIAQGGTDWSTDDSLLDRLMETAGTSADQIAQLLVGHRFPLALAERSLRSLSPGERVRAALICLWRQRPPIECLVLDEPTYSLDFMAAAALTKALAAWPGGLVVTSHDRSFLNAIRLDRTLDLSPAQTE